MELYNINIVTSITSNMANSRWPINVLIEQQDQKSSRLRTLFMFWYLYYSLKYTAGFLCRWGFLAREYTKGASNLGSFTWASVAFNNKTITTTTTTRIGSYLWNVYFLSVFITNNLYILCVYSSQVS